MATDLLKTSKERWTHWKSSRQEIGRKWETGQYFTWLLGHVYTPKRVPYKNHKAFYTLHLTNCKVHTTLVWRLECVPSVVPVGRMEGVEFSVAMAGSQGVRETTLALLKCSV